MILQSSPALSLVVKLGTIAPEGSPWYEALLEMGDEWQRISKGEVKLRIYGGGVAGDEPDMLRKIRIGQLHAAALATSGLKTIVSETQILSFPMLIQTDGELDHILEKFGPHLEAQLEKKGFKVLNWSSAGWAYFFTRSPVVTTDDLKKHKLFFWGSDTSYVELLKRSGFQPVPLAVTDLLPSLQTGLVDAFGAPPAAALSFQWFSLAPNMTDLKFEPLPGATVISVKSWKKIPEELRPSLEKAAREIGARLQKRILELNDEAVEAMKGYGLKVIQVPPEDYRKWMTQVEEKATPDFLKERFSLETFEEIKAALKEYRRAQPAENRAE
jgi:TRAP-type C4-dicarboxylate transport system substrate-binding protein